jgi:predicted transcriptional regulator
MAIVVSLSPELEARLREKAAQQGQDISFVAAELLKSILEGEIQDSEAVIKGIEQGLEECESGSFRSLEEFTDNQLDKTARGRKMAEILEKLAMSQTMTDIDPIIWQQDNRQDRLLPGR